MMVDKVIHLCDTHAVIFAYRPHNLIVTEAMKSDCMVCKNLESMKGLFDRSSTHDRANAERAVDEAWERKT